MKHGEVSACLMFCFLSNKTKEMRKMKMYQVDAFTQKLFAGNPAAVCVLDEWLPDEIMQSIAAENNLAETAFTVNQNNQFEIRWFTPTVEVDLCGHATLATAFVLFQLLDYPVNLIPFWSPRSGSLSVSNQNGLFQLDFPTDKLEKVSTQQYHEITDCIGMLPVELFKGKTDYLAVIDSEDELLRLIPNFDAIQQLHARGLIVTAPGNEVDFVSRFFAPQSGVDEDPVTGSAHTSLIPYWHNRIGKTQMRARQISKRGGDLICEFQGERCFIGGHARLYLTGEIEIN